MLIVACVCAGAIMCAVSCMDDYRATPADYIANMIFGAVVGGAVAIVGTIL